jgi:glycosyltransferase involved in cell wall biosynthesis
MRICLFNVTSTIDQIGSSEVGGVEAYSFRLGQALQKRGHEVVLWGGKPKFRRTFYESGLELQLRDYLETSQIPNLGTRFRRLVQRLHFSWATRKEFARESFDAILLFKPYDFVSAWLWRGRGIRSRIVTSIHGPEFYWVDSIFSHYVDDWYAVSPSTAKAVEVRYRRPCKVLPNFIDLQDFPFVDRPGEPGEKMILTVGRLVGWKGISQLVEAFQKVHERIPQTKLVVIGDGPEKGNLEALAQSLGLKEAVQFPGVLSREAVLKYHQAAWVLVQPSVGYESFSISVLEALASGVPVLASDQVGIVDWFRDEEALEVYPSNQPEQLVERLHAMLSCPWSSLRARAQKARKIAEREFAVERVVPEIEKLCLKS